MQRWKIEMTRQMIAEGFSDAEIEEHIDMVESEWLAEREEQAHNGDFDDNYVSSRDKEMGDRLDMGRNEAGEWLGFC